MCILTHTYTHAHNHLHTHVDTLMNLYMIVHTYMHGYKLVTHPHILTYMYIHAHTNTQTHMQSLSLEGNCCFHSSASPPLELPWICLEQRAPSTNKCPHWQNLVPKPLPSPKTPKLGVGGASDDPGFAFGDALAPKDLED